MKLLLDQGLPRSAAGLLRSDGFDVQHTGECGMSRSSDIEIIEYARREDRIVITLDADFHAIMALSEAIGPSVVRVRIEGLKSEAMANLLRQVLDKCRNDLATGALVSVTPGRIRIHKLPLTRR